MSRPRSRSVPGRRRLRQGDRPSASGSTPVSFVRGARILSVKVRSMEIADAGHSKPKSMSRNYSLGQSRRWPLCWWPPVKNTGISSRMLQSMNCGRGWAEAKHLAVPCGRWQSSWLLPPKNPEATGRPHCLGLVQLATLPPAFCKTGQEPPCNHALILITGFPGGPTASLRHGLANLAQVRRVSAIQA